MFGGGTIFNQDLCPWKSENPLVGEIYDGCPSCLQNCSSSPSPSLSPSPSSSPSPSLTKLIFQTRTKLQTEVDTYCANPSSYDVTYYG